MGARLVASGETRAHSDIGQFPPSEIHHPVWIWCPSGPIFEAEVKTNRMDFLPADVLDSVVEVAMWIVHSYIRLLSTYICGEFARRLAVVAVQEGDEVIGSRQNLFSFQCERVGEKHKLVTETQVLREHRLM